MIRTGIAAAAALLAATAAPVAAKSLLSTPVYNPDTKSYFELVPAPRGYSGRDRSFNEIPWQSAANVAAGRMHKGVRGRLAIVKSQATNDFLINTFKPESAAWIGLRFFCQVRRLMWVNGDVHPTNAYANWGRSWQAAGDTPCAPDHQFAPIALSPAQGGWRWEGRGQAKEFYAFFVEYPTGQP